MDLYRQLRNDEKRAQYASVDTISAGSFPEGMVAGDTLFTTELNGESFAIRAYIVISEAFPALSTCSYGYMDAETGALIDNWFPNVDLTVVGAFSALVPVRSYPSTAQLGFVLPQVVIDSAVGKAQIVYEFVEESVRTGKYTG